MFRRPRRLVVPARLRDRLATHVADAHPLEAGGFLACDATGRTLRAVEHVPLANDADEPGRRFVAAVDERAPPQPRVFYHSHTSAASPSGLTETDRRHIPERYALVVFAPHGEPFSYRLFRRGLVAWRELAVERPTRDPTAERTLPRLR